MSLAEKPVVAVFDFDGTLTQRDTLLPFLMQALGIAKVAYHGLVLTPILLGYALRVIRNGAAKEKVFVQCFSGVSADELKRKAEHFAQTGLPRLINPRAMQRFAWHKSQGHRCVVISASLKLYVKPWAVAAGFDDVVATRLEVLENGRVSGKLAGENCYGAEKLRQLEALLGSMERYILYAYGDSRGDKELLSAADHAYYREMPSE